MTTRPPEIDRALARFQAEGSGGQIILHVDRTGTVRKVEIRETIAVKSFPPNRQTVGTSRAEREVE